MKIKISFGNIIRQGINSFLDFFGLQLINKSIRYAEDGLHTIHNHDFLRDAYFNDTLNYVSSVVWGDPNKLRYRIYIAIKLAEYAKTLTLNFCECGVGDGVISLSILKYFHNKEYDMPNLWLFDTFSGIEESIVPAEEIKYWGVSVLEKKKQFKKIYGTDFDKIREQFAKFPNRTTFIKGPIPETFSTKLINDLKSEEPISFLHIDMNNSVPEVAAFKTLVPFVAPGGIVLLDDYAYCGYKFQKGAIDAVCSEMKLPIPISLPTGQGLFIKPNILV